MAISKQLVITPLLGKSVAVEGDRTYFRNMISDFTKYEVSTLQDLAIKITQNEGQGMYHYTFEDYDLLSNGSSYYGLLIYLLDMKVQ